MKIKKINIKKFRQLENVCEENIGLVNELYGSNGSGKTSFISFITWMIYDETLDYGKSDDMNIDTFKPNELIGGEITLSDNENEITLAREFGYNEKNNVVQRFFINGRQTKNQSEYYAKVNECFGINDKLSGLKIKNFNLQRALIDPYYLPSNENQFRELISKVLELDTHIILLNLDKYNNIKKDLYNQDYNCDNLKDFYNQQLKEIDKNLIIQNSLIEECKKVKFNQEEYKNAKNELQELNNYQIESNEELTKKISELNQAQLDLFESRNKDIQDRPISQEEMEYNENKNKYNKLAEEYNDKFFKNKTIKQTREHIETKINNLKEQLKQAKELTFKEIRCPNCEKLINENDYKQFNENKVKAIKSIKDKLTNAYDELDKYVLIDTNELENTLNSLLIKIRDYQSTKTTNVINYSSDETKRLETLVNELKLKVESLQQQDFETRNKIISENNAKISELRNKISEMEINKSKALNITTYQDNKNILLENKSIYELRLSLLNEYRLDEIQLIKNKTSEIFGNDFDFEMLVKSKSNDNYKKVCYASINGLEHNKSNTAKYLKYSIILLEKLKEYIGGCDLPIIFDIADNIGKTTRNEIFNLVKNSQVFYTRISDEDNVERKLNVIK